MKSRIDEFTAKYIGKALATFASACVCGYLIHISNGETGIGWFIVSLLFIW